VQRVVPNVWGLLVSSPVYIVWIVGLVIAVTRWSRHPQVSLLAVSGLAILLVREVVATLVAPWLQMSLIRGSMMPSRLGFIFGLLNFVGALIRAVGYGLVLAALFTRRPDRDAALEREGL
jgi:hypothetical protein